MPEYKYPRGVASAPIVSGSLKPSSLNSTINLSSFGKRRDFGDIELPAYSLVNLSFTKELNKKTKISFKLENMFDKEYYTAATSNAFYMSQGRSIWFKLHYDLGR